MAISGFLMIAFVLVHLLGNASIYSGPNGINAYAMALHSFPPFIWAFRITMLTLFCLHVFYGIQLTIENRGAKPGGYAIQKSLGSTYASRNMIWTGLLIGAFLIFHLLHFTIQVIDPGISAKSHGDALGRPDVFLMVVKGFEKSGIVSVYLIAMAALWLHLLHSIQSAFQTVGLNSERSLPVIVKVGTFAAIFIFLGFAAMPMAVLTGLLK